MLSLSHITLLSLVTTLATAMTLDTSLKPFHVFSRRQTETGASNAPTCIFDANLADCNSVYPHTNIPNPSWCWNSILAVCQDAAALAPGNNTTLLYRTGNGTAYGDQADCIAWATPSKDAPVTNASCTQAFDAVLGCWEPQGKKYYNEECVGATWNLQHTTTKPGALVDAHLPEYSVGTPEIFGAEKVTVGPAPQLGDGGVAEPEKAAPALGSSLSADEAGVGEGGGSGARGAVMGGFLGTDPD